MPTANPVPGDVRHPCREFPFEARCVENDNRRIAAPWVVDERSRSPHGVEMKLKELFYLLGVRPGLRRHGGHVAIG